MTAVFYYFPFSTGVGAPSSEGSWSQMMIWMRTTGILASSSVLSQTGDSFVAPFSGLTLQIYPCEAYMQGFYFQYTIDPFSPGNYTFSVGSNPGPDDRIDVAVLTVNTNTNEIFYEVLVGTPGAPPVAPAPEQTASLWQVPLAQIYVAAGAVTINSGDITDVRPRSVQAEQGSSPGVSCVLTRSSDFSISTSSTAAIQFTVVESDPYGMQDQSHNTRINIPFDGFYLCAINCESSSAATTLWLLRNGTETIVKQQNAPSTPSYFSMSRVIELSEGDYIETWMTNGAATTAVVFTANVSPIFQVSKLT